MSIQESKKSAGGSQKPIVLLVEDDKFLRDLIIQKLDKEGFSAQAAIEAKEAFKLIEEKKPQLILLDLVLPGMDGFAMMHKLKENPQTADIPVIILSNLGQKEDLERAMIDGAADYLVKANFTPGEIVDKIRIVLGKKYI
jgi:DNA-binding response OmpR family regulator